FGQRMRILALLNVSVDKRAGARKIGIHLAHSAKLFDGTVILPGEVKSCSMVPGNDHREWIELARPFAFRQGLIEAPLERKALCIPLVSRAVAEIQLDGLSEFLLRRLPVIIIILGNQCQ